MGIENHQTVARWRHFASTAPEACWAPACCERFARQREDVPERLQEHGPAITGWTLTGQD